MLILTVGFGELVFSHFPHIFYLLLLNDKKYEKCKLNFPKCQKLREIGEIPQTSKKFNSPESFILCALATKDVFAWMNPNRLSTTTSLISMQMISTNWT